MKPKSFLPQSPLAAVRADTTIGDCIRILRDRSIGSLVILSSNAREEIVGVFTERDLVKNIELIQKGGFWDQPVRTVMSATVRTVSPENIHEAPKIMARYNIRHLPVVVEEKGRRRVVGVVSMRDLFRVAMEHIDYDLARLLSPPAPAASPRPKRKLVAVYSSDRSIRDLVDRGARLTKHLMVKAQELENDIDAMEEAFSRFEVLVVDIDGMNPVQLGKFLALLRTTKAAVHVVFSPPKIGDDHKAKLHKLADDKRVQLIAKPIALGLFYEKFLKRL